MKLYYSKGACSLVVRIILNELNLPFEVESVDLQTKKTEKGIDFFTINAKGSVPVLSLDNGNILTENAVILQYLADTSKATQLLPAIDDFKRYQVLEWLNFVTTEMHKGIGILFNPQITDTMRNVIFMPLIHKKLTYLNSHLTEKEYLLGDHFTLPDAYLLVMLRWLHHFKVDFSQWPNVEHFFQTLSKRPSVVKSLKQED
jgi:glutathione S-transferase